MVKVCIEMCYNRIYNSKKTNVICHTTRIQQVGAFWIVWDNRVRG